MQCTINNQTPLPAHINRYWDLTGKEYVLVIAKASWHLDTGRLAPAEQQTHLIAQPQLKRFGALDLDDAQLRALGSRQDEDIVWLDHEMSPPKPAFDVLVAGYVTAPPSYNRPSIEAGIRIGEHTARLVAHVPRYWDVGWLGDSAQPLSNTLRRVPLTYAVSDWVSGFPLEARNNTPQWLPWIEAIKEDARRTRYAQNPAGFGFWPENAAHRAPYCGTFDDVWKQTRSPALPVDFNARFYNVAHPDLQLPCVPKPGTPIRLVHLAEKPILDTQMPTLALAVQTTTNAGVLGPITLLRPDTLTIEPDQSRLSLVWRALLPTDVGSLGLRSIRLFKAEAYTS